MSGKSSKKNPIRKRAFDIDKSDNDNGRPKRGTANPDAEYSASASNNSQDCQDGGVDRYDRANQPSGESDAPEDHPSQAIDSKTKSKRRGANPMTNDSKDQIHREKRTRRGRSGLSRD